MAGVWGTLATGIFAVPALAENLATGTGGLWYTGSFDQLGTQALGLVAVGAFTFTASFGALWVMKVTVGIRVEPEVETAGLDVSEHGMWGYPEFYIPVPGGYGTETHGHLGLAHAQRSASGAEQSPPSSGAASPRGRESRDQPAADESFERPRRRRRAGGRQHHGELGTRPPASASSSSAARASPCGGGGVPSSSRSPSEAAVVETTRHDELVVQPRSRRRPAGSCTKSSPPLIPAARFRPVSPRTTTRPVVMYSQPCAPTPLDDGNGARVADREALAGRPAQKSSPPVAP